MEVMELSIPETDVVAHIPPTRYIESNGRSIPVYGRLADSARRCIVQRVALLCVENPAEGDGPRRDGE